MSRGHRIKEFLRYRRKALSRHGVHSPFVYELTDKLLSKKSPAANLILATSRHKKLVNKIITWFGCRHILWLTNRDGETETFLSIEREADNRIRLKTERFDYVRFSAYPAPDLYLIDLSEPTDWLQAWQRYRAHIRPDDIVLITSLHHSKAHSEAWKMIREDETVRLSLDLFKLGLLLFRQEFREKQHFQLRYPA